MSQTIEIDDSLAALLWRFPGIARGAHVTIPESSEDATRGKLRSADVRVGWDFTLEQLIKPLLAPASEYSIYEYQSYGVEWLERTPRALLADDMGLGKTVQAILALRRLIHGRRAFNALVIAPTSLALNWLAEFAKWAPDLAVTVVRPSQDGAVATWRLRVGRAHVHITTFEHVRNFDRNLQDAFDVVIVDEAQRVKNPQSRQSRGLWLLQPNYLWLLSGTPLERDSADFLALLTLLDKGRFSADMSKLSPDYVRAVARPYVLRRRKADVLTQLPPKNYVHEILEMLPEQRAEYGAVLRQSIGDDVLSRYGRLRAICDVSSQGSGAKLVRLAEIIDKILSQGESAVVFSFWLDILKVAYMQTKTTVDGPVQLLESSMSLIQRQSTVKSFQQHGGVLFAAGHVAGEGLTLTRANHVILLNRWWNPSKNAQVEDRACRIGQDLPVSIYTFTMANTVEEALDEMLVKKSDAQEVFVNLLSSQLDLTLS